jgi:hypothetical protein
MVLEWKEKRVLLGVRPGPDGYGHPIKSLMKLTKTLYQERRKNTLIIGMTCNEMTDDSCFCTLTESGPDSDKGYDLLMTEIGDSYFFKSGSPEGERLLEKSYFKEVSPQEVEARAQKIEKPERIKKKNKLDLTRIKRLWAAYDNRSGINTENGVTWGPVIWLPHLSLFHYLDKATWVRLKARGPHLGFMPHEKARWPEIQIRPKGIRLKHRLYDKFYYPYITMERGSAWCDVSAIVRAKSISVKPERGGPEYPTCPNWLIQGITEESGNIRTLPSFMIKLSIPTGTVRRAIPFVWTISRASRVIDPSAGIFQTTIRRMGGVTRHRDLKVN